MFDDVIGYCVIDGNYVEWSLAPDKYLAVKFNNAT